MHFDRAEVVGVDGEVATGAALLGYMEAEEYVERMLGDEMGSRELIKLCIRCWDHLMLYIFSGSVAVWMFLSGDLQHSVQGTLWPLSPTRPPSTPFWLISTQAKTGPS
jgi:hypothetical protein